MHHSWYLLACCPLEDIAPPNINEDLDSSVSFPLHFSPCSAYRGEVESSPSLHLFDIRREGTQRRRHPFTFLLSHRHREYRVSFANGLNGSSCKETSRNIHTFNPFPCAPIHWECSRLFIHTTLLPFTPTSSSLFGSLGTWGWSASESDILMIIC